MKTINRIICPDCGYPIIVYCTKEYKTGLVQYGRCKCEIKYNKWCELVSSNHKAISRFNGNCSIRNLKPIKR